MKHHHRLDLTVRSGDRFEVRKFHVREALHELYRVELVVASEDRTIDLDVLVGQTARFRLQRASSMASRSWEGIVTSCEHDEIVEDVTATYRIVVEPPMWLLTQRRNYRIFQQSSDPSTARQVLADWGIAAVSAYDDALYPGRKYRVQYAESDYDFVRRLLEDAGITFYFEERDGKNELVMSDAPHAASVRSVPVHYENQPTGELLREVATRVRVTRKLRPGRYTQRDVDYRRSPEFPLMASSTAGSELEQRLERFHQNYGAFLFSALPSGDSPIADDRGAARTDLTVGNRQVARRLAAKRSTAKRVTFSTTIHDLAPGTVFVFGSHPRHDLSEAERLLVVSGELKGDCTGDWNHEVEAHFAREPYHPPLVTPKPKTFGIESATVVGPDDDEIHTDEFARVRVQFHWDRSGMRNTQSSCWIPVSQPWGGAGFGGVNIPRVGQEVIVDFLGADPDRPVITGRVFTKTNPVPYKLPEHKTISGLRSRSANRMVMGANDGVVGMPEMSTHLPMPSQMPGGSGLPMGPRELQSALDEGLFGAVSPSTDTHNWPGSEFTMDDRFGREMVYLQAERDMNTIVKNSSTAVVGNRRATRIGTDDILNVNNEQLIRTGADRCVRVEASQTHLVENNISQQAVTGNQLFQTQETFASRAKFHISVSDESTTMNVGESTVFMRPDFIIVQTPFLFLNPGQEALEEAMQTGVRPSTLEELAQQRYDAHFDGARAEVEAAWERGEIRTGGDMQRYYNSFDTPLRHWDEAPRRAALLDFEKAHAVTHDPSMIGSAQSFYHFDTPPGLQ